MNDIQSPWTFFWAFILLIFLWVGLVALFRLGLFSRATPLFPDVSGLRTKKVVLMDGEYFIIREFAMSSDRNTGNNYTDLDIKVTYSRITRAQAIEALAEQKKNQKY